ncbi:MAG: hypothetical protein S4CHLAM6_06150 [Chlamydiae bacterium]|nr:hypothetical protein [Chlamydiota bacterium]
MLQCDQRFSKDSKDSSTIFEGFFVVQNDKGLHTRPSTELVKCSCKFSSKINLILDDTVVNAKSILGILMLAACKGTKILIEAKGEDAKEAVEAIQQLSNQKFHIEY